MSKNRLQIALADDNSSDRARLVKLLGQHLKNSEIHEIDSRKSLDHCLKHCILDAMITEYWFSWINGLELLELVKSMQPRCQVLMLSTTVDTNVTVAAMKAGAADYLTKDPKSYDRIPRTLQGMLEKVARKQQILLAGNRYQAFFEGLPFGLFQVTLNGKLLDVNQFLVQLLGYPDKALFLSTPLKKFFINSAGLEQICSLIPKQAVLENMDVQLRTYDGTALWVTVLGNCVKDSQGNIFVQGSVQDVRQRKARDEALQAQCQFMEILTNSISYPVYYKGKEGLYQGCNQAFCDYLGLTRDRIIGHSDSDLFRSGQAEEFGTKDQELIAAESPQVLETVIKHADGSEHNVIFNKALFYNEDGSIGGIIGSIMDITYRKQSESALADSEQRFRRLIEDHVDAVLIVDKQGIIQWVNPAAEKLMGQPASALIGHEFQYLTAEREIEEVEIKRPGQNSLYAELKISETEWQQQPVLLASIRDITKRKQMEQALEQVHQIYQQSIENAHSVPYRLYYKNKRYEYIGPTITEIIGISPKELTLTKFAALVQEVHVLDTDVNLSPEEYTAAFRQGTISKYRVDLRLKLADGSERWLNDCAVPIKAEGSGETIGSLGILTDITYRKNFERERGELEAQFQHIQKMEALGRIAGGVAHDFNNILTVVHGNADLLLLDVDENSAVREKIRQIKESANRASALTRQLLAFSRKQIMQPVVLDLNTLVMNLETMLRRLVSKNVLIDTMVDRGTSQVNADPGQIEQVIMNLCMNASDALPEGGHIWIQTEECNLTEADCKILPYARPGEFVCLSVKDDGHGIDAETIGHIFEPFFTTKTTGKGIGLGLSVAYGIIKQHEGWINAYSEVGLGTIFRVYLPALKEISEKLSPAQTFQKYAGHNEKILLVEDEEGVLHITRSFLEKSGYRVWTAVTAQEGVDLFAARTGQFDMLICDIVLPDWSGLEVAERIHNQKPEIKVLMTSGYIDDKSELSRIDEKGFRFIQKPYQVAEILGAVHEMLSEKET